MFMYSLDGDAHEWDFSLPLSSISSLKDFHTVFHEHCKRYFLDEFLFENCCEEYELHDEDEIFYMATSEEYSQLIVDGKIHDYVIENATTPNSYQQDGKVGKEEDNLLSAVFFHNFVLQQEEFLSPYIPLTSNLDEKMIITRKIMLMLFQINLSIMNMNLTQVLREMMRS